VGRLAGLPAPVIARARALLRLLEGEDLAAALAGRGPKPGAARAKAVETPQLGLFAPSEAHPLLKQLAALEPNEMTPLDALARLATLVADARKMTDDRR
jgi:DNA mismatch repair protein MutS